MPSPEFVDEVLSVVQRIPPGRVMTYGDIAWALGSNAPRAVGRVLALYGHSVSWWRVVPSNGKPPQGHAREALPHYLEEGTPLRVVASEGHAQRSVMTDDGKPELAPEDYRIALSSARLGYDHEIYSEVAP